jgi:hypothetical protein
MTKLWLVTHFPAALLPVDVEFAKGRGLALPDGRRSEHSSFTN